MSTTFELSFTLCRLELKGNKYVLGEFLEFKGKPEDIMALGNIKRSKVSRLIIQKMSMFGLGNHPRISCTVLVWQFYLLMETYFD